ncbi:MAG: hypothetical protein HYU87_09140 [Chloroflexi bacterium]|nr:hypothetical protein [Chloroflexota bacterium]
MRRAVAAAATLLVLALSAPSVVAAADPSRLALTAPATARFGETIGVGARLTDGQGAPISGARIVVVTPMRFLNGAGDAVLLDGRTDKDGSVAGEIAIRSTEPLALRARFGGDTQYDAAEAAARISVEGEAVALYEQHAGARVPMLNQAPGADGVSLAAGAGDGVLGRMRELWPALSGWPIAAALITVWSIFAFAVSLLFRIRSAGALP